MKTRTKLVWKLIAVVVAILVVTVGLSGYLHNRIWEDYSLASGQAFLRLNSESMVQGFGNQMMSRHDQGIKDLIDKVFPDSPVFRDIRLVSHHSGKVVASRSNGDFGSLKLEDWACAVCHDRKDLGGDEPKTMGTIIDPSEGGRLLTVMAPIVNEPRCNTAACHFHADHPPVLGFVNADYSLQPNDAWVAERKTHSRLAVLSSLLLGVVACWFMFGLLLEKPIRELIEGTKRIAAHQLDFRFDRKRTDEIGLLEESFNAMTTRIQAHRDELRSAMEYLGGIVENSADIIITVTPEGFIETFNRGAEQVLGHQRIEVIGKPIEILFADPRERDVAIGRLKHADNVRNYETRFLAKDGQVRNVLLTLSRLRDRDGNPIGTVGISKDITPEKKLQDELRDAKEYLEGMVENSSAIIITVNSKGLIETFNRGAEEALGYRREEVIGEPIESLYVDPRDRYAAAIRLGEMGNVNNLETRLRAKEGGFRNVLLTLSRLLDSEGRPIGTVGVSKDITQEKRLQRELMQSQKFAAIGQAVTGIQHAIKNMLNGLKGGAYLIRNGLTKDNRERIEEGCVMVEEGIEPIANLSRNMLNFARDWKPVLQRVDLNDLVVSLCDANRQTAADQGLTLRHETTEGLTLVLCDPTLIHMATTDILVNALDACTKRDYQNGERPEVVLRTSSAEDEDSCVIEVRDNGCGMTEAVREKIFTPFFSTKETLGTGLGLAVTAKIIRVHEGEISVESEPDRGTTFRIRIPQDGPQEIGEETDDGQTSARG